MEVSVIFWNEPGLQFAAGVLWDALKAYSCEAVHVGWCVKEEQDTHVKQFSHKSLHFPLIQDSPKQWLVPITTPLLGDHLVSRWEVSSINYICSEDYLQPLSLKLMLIDSETSGERIKYMSEES